VPVWVGKDRFSAGVAVEVIDAKELDTGPSITLRYDRQIALRNDRRNVHLLDDGFQHRGLARAMDVVLVTAEDLEDALLPAGNLRAG
jgi:tetraacyldisaccharide 4'-kinase